MNTRIAFLFTFTIMSFVAYWSFFQAAPVSQRQFAQQPRALASIEDLLEQRRDVLAEAFKAQMHEFKFGNCPPDRAMRLSDQLLAAEIELAADDGTRMKAYLAHLRSARDFEKMAMVSLNAGQGTRQEFLDAKAQRLMAEINIARLKK